MALLLEKEFDNFQFVGMRHSVLYRKLIGLGNRTRTLKMVGKCFTGGRVITLKQEWRIYGLCEHFLRFSQTLM